MIEKTCIVCGKVWRGYRAETHVCSNECWNALRKKERYLKTCELCGCSFSTYKKDKRFCKKCDNNVRSKSRYNKRENKTACTVCGVEIPQRSGMPLYCATCNPYRKVEARGLVCASCGKTFMSNCTSARFCSKKCRCYDWARKYRAKKYSAEGTFTAAEFAALCEAYDNRCARCGTKTKLTADHVIPLIAGGSNMIDNIQPLCKPCNSSKKDKLDGWDFRKKFS